jgi:AcrR family transcriptional regulator
VARAGKRAIREPARAAREPLSRERIEIAALQLIERDGLDGFSIRKLAADLGCEAMSVYHHFPSKAHIMDALIDRVVGEIEIPSRSLSWQERLRGFAWEYRAMALRYPRFFQFAVLHRMNTAAALGVIEEAVTVFRDAGFSLEMSARLFRVLGYYIAGGSLDEAEGYAKGPSAVEPVPDDVAVRDYPEITAVNPFFKPQHHEATFALGLDILIDGAERVLRKGRMAAGKPPLAPDAVSSKRQRSARSQ